MFPKHITPFSDWVQLVNYLTGLEDLRVVQRASVNFVFVHQTHKFTSQILQTPSVLFENI